MRAAKLMGAAVVAAVAAGFLLMLVGSWSDTIQRGRQKRAMGELRTLATAVESYSIDHERYPSVESIWELVEFIEPTYLKATPLLDPWGEPYDYWSLTPEIYYIRSGGSDRSFQYFDPRDYLGRRVAGRFP